MSSETMLPFILSLVGVGQAVEDEGKDVEHDEERASHECKLPDDELHSVTHKYTLFLSKRKGWACSPIEHKLPIPNNYYLQSSNILAYNSNF